MEQQEIAQATRSKKASLLAALHTLEQELLELQQVRSNVLGPVRNSSRTLTLIDIDVNRTQQLTLRLELDSGA
jgi:hypothetical protein